MDVRLKLPAPPGELQKQVAAYRDAAELCFAEPACKAILLWGFTGKYSWIPKEFPDPGDALIFDKFYRPKPAYMALQEAFEKAVINLSQKIWVVGSYFRSEDLKEFVVLPKCWIVESTFAQLNNHRRLSKNYERFTRISETIVQLAMLRLMLRRLKPF
jgi:transposase